MGTFFVLLNTWLYIHPHIPARDLVLWLAMLCFWPIFCIAGRRLHDCGLTSFFAGGYLILPVLFAILRMASPFWRQFSAWLLDLHLLRAEHTFILALTLVGLGYIGLASLVLLFVPGSREANRYGEPPGKPNPALDFF